MFDFLTETFMLRAFIVGILVSLTSALLGVSLVLKRYSMIGDGLSHVGFGALSIAAVFGIAPLAVALPVVTVAAFLLLRLNESSKIKGDSAIAIISTGSLAIGIIAVSISGGMTVDISNYLFGSILTMSHSDVVLSTILASSVILIFVLFYNKIFAVTFDESFSRATGIKAGGYNSLIAVLTAVTVVVGMRMMGTLLISSLIIFPALTSIRIFKSFKSVIICSSILSVSCFFIGLVSSYILETPTGATVVCINIIAYIVFYLISYVKRKLLQHRRSAS
ncbi:MAG: metal ABC transporter permease [Clostridia bacterium]|nr:metal ABC transporter permease [Clostridia bacterium]